MTKEFICFPLAEQQRNSIMIYKAVTAYIVHIFIFLFLSKYEYEIIYTFIINE